MKKMEFMWKDVSDVPGIETRAEQAPDLRRDLIQLGFRSAGYVQRWNPWVTEKKTADLAKKIYDESTSKMITGTDWVQEIYASPDGRALASLRMTPVGPAVNFRSVSEGGWVVDTGSGMARGARYRMNPFGLMAKLGGALRPVKTKADSGYFNHEEAAGMAELWELHKQRVQSILESNGQKLRLQGGTAVYVAGAYHLHRILVSESEATGRFLRILSVASRVLTVVIGLFFCIALLALYNMGRVNFPTTMLIIGLTFLGVLGAMILSTEVFHGYILPRLAGPPPMMLDDLLREVQSHSAPPAAE